MRCWRHKIRKPNGCLWDLLRSHQERARLVHRMAEREQNAQLSEQLQGRASDYDEDAGADPEVSHIVAAARQRPHRRWNPLEHEFIHSDRKTRCNIVPRSGNRGPAGPIVGIGASAGGLDALQRFFPMIAPDCGLAFVVVQHLAPEHRSRLADLLARSSRLQVTLIERETAVQPNHVFVIPPNATLTIKAGRLHLQQAHSVARAFAPRSTASSSPWPRIRERTPPASSCPAPAATVRWVCAPSRSMAGPTLAPTAESAEYDGMMRSAVATGLVDFVLPAEEMPARLVEYFRHVSKLNDDAGSASIETGRRQSSRHGSGSFSAAGPVTISALQGASRCSAASSAACRCCRSRGWPISSSGCVTDTDEVDASVPGPADRRHQFLSGHRGIRGAGASGHSASVRGQGCRHGSGLGARLLDRR